MMRNSDPLGHFLEVTVVGNYHANDVGRQTIFFRNIFTQNFKRIFAIYTPNIMYFHAKELSRS